MHQLRPLETELLDPVANLIPVDAQELPGVRLVAASPFEGLHQQLLSVDFARVEGKYVLFLAIGTLLVGFSEEMLCRGLGLVGLRGSLRGLVWSCRSADWGR